MTQYPPALGSALRSPYFHLLRAGRSLGRIVLWVLLIGGWSSKLALAADPLISEFMASNRNGIVDEDGDTSDWVELFNPGTSPINLSGWRLTDDLNTPDKWIFPATNLPPNGFLLVWASAKNRAIPGAPLHANFSLGSQGEYLALVRPDGTPTSEFNPYPKQYDDIAYGVLMQTDTSRFIATNSTAKIYIPSNNTLGLTWTARTGFAETGWAAATNGIGFEQSVPGFLVRNFKANGTVGDIVTASNVISNPSQQTAVYVETKAVINYFNSGGTGNYASDNPFPGFDFATDQDNFVVEAVGTVTIPAAGAYTFGVNSDDGFYLQVGTSSVSFPSPRGPADTLGTFNFAAAGDYPLRLIFYEQGGGSGVELFAAKGSFISWNATNFRLVGDTAGGGLVIRSQAQGQSSGIRSLLKTDLIGSMYNKAADLYIRYPFTVSSPEALSTLTLDTRYDDGAAIYLNGTLVATRNTPVPLAFNSLATVDRTNAAVLVKEAIDLTPNLNLLVAGANVLAVQALNRATNNNDFLFITELSEYRTTLLTNNYITTASPGSQNGTQVYNKVRDTHFSHDRGFYSTNFNLTISSETPGATIRYTLDGTLPTLVNGATYTTPIAITKTTTVRAAAFKTGFVSSDVDTHTYIYTRDVILQSPNGEAPGPNWPAPRTSGGQVYDYGMDPEVVTNAPWKQTIEDDLKSLPSFSVVMNLNDLFDPATGIYANPGGDTLVWERSCSLELIQPDGSKGFHENCGIRIRGGFSRTTDNPKHAFRFFFREEYGSPKLNYPVFGSKGANSFDKFDLRTTQNYSWAFQGDGGSIFLRDQFSRDTQLDMGQLGERGNWFHLYINGVYWGLYNTDERAEAAFGETYLGGQAEDYDTIKVGPDLGYNIYATDGNLDAWTRLWQAANAGFSTDASYFAIQGLNPDGSPNPALETLLDVPNLIDYMMVIIFGGNLDAPISAFLGNNSPNNWFGIRDRTGAHGGFRFMSHDAEHTLLNPNEDRTGPFVAGDPLQGSSFVFSNPQYIFTRLWANTEFRMTCADRIHKHFFNDGVFTVAKAQARLDARTNEIFRALVPESARWGDAKKGSGAPLTRNNFLDAYNNVRNNYLPVRGGIVLTQLRADGLYPATAAPTFSKFGGLVPFGYNLVITNNQAAGTLYYTLDGSDPRVRGGAINPAAIAYSAPIVLNTARTVRARLKDGSSWSAIVEATFYPIENFDGLSITEIMYNPPGDATLSGDEFEFVELKNTTANPLDLSGLSFSDGINFSFTNATKLAAGQFAVLVRNTNAFKARYPAVPIFGVFTGRLDNGGETIRLKHVLGGTVFTVTYDDDLPWPIAPDGYGYSLVPKAVNPASNSEDGSQWRASAALLGSPGADDPAPTITPILINEALTHTDLPDVDAIELYNPTDGTVNLGGWFLSDDASLPRKFRIPANTLISPHGYKVFTEADFNADITSSNSFRLSSVGDQIYLLSGDANTNLTGYSHGFAFGASQNGVTFGRYVNSQGEEHFPAQISRTLGATNSGPKIGPIVINEVHYHPALTFDEFIELHSVVSTNVPLFDPNFSTNTWKLSGLNFTFPQNISIPPGGFLILSPIDPTVFRTRYGVPASTQILGPYTGGLQDSGERLELTRPDPPNTNGTVPQIVVDAVRYNDKEPWPVVADGSGPSLQRLIAKAYGDEPTNWFASGITPGRTNLPNALPTVKITSPLEGASFLPPATVTINADAKDSDGALLRVEFYDNGIKLGEDATEPYSFSWVNPPTGTHSLTARAIDTQLGIGISEPVEIIVFTPTPTTVISKGSVWKYLDTGVAPAANWITNNFNDSAWSSGPAQLGYSPDEKDEATTVSFGPDANAKYITTWFRRSFPLSNVSRFVSLNVSVLRDDGAVVYLNGIEIFRSNMPLGAILPSTLASSAVGGGDETSVFYSTNVPVALLREGTNLVAVELHQSSGSSTDISFDLELTGTLAPQLPTVAITSPVNDTHFIAPATVGITATATDVENGINRVEFYQGSTKLGQDNSDPYTFSWASAPAGSYALRAVAVNTLGISRTSSIVNIVIEANLAPTVAITNPAPNSVFIQPSSITLGASAADPDGSVTQVAFLVDNAPLGQDSSSPYSFVWNNPAIGTHTLTAVATDNRGATTQSAPITVLITNRLSQPFTLVSQGSLWKYNDQGVDLDGLWTPLSYNDSGWSNGLAQLGYSPDENDEATLLQFGNDSNNKRPTYYFRQAFRVADATSITQLALRYLRDDGIVAYLNGVEILRNNMPTGSVTYATLAVNSVAAPEESAFFTNSIDPARLITGTNILAVEIHQQSTNSSDLSFDAELSGAAEPFAPLINTQPSGLSRLPGESATLYVTAGGSTPLGFQWYKGTNLIQGARSASLVLSNLSGLDAAGYSVVVSNNVGSVTSLVANLSVHLPPSITLEPTDIIVPVNASGSFVVNASGDVPLRYQWVYEGQPIVGANDSTYLLQNVTQTQAGQYWVQVSNLYGAVLSRKAVLTVSTPDTDGDGLPDWWEDLYGFNKNSDGEASLDADGDGMSNLQEFLAGTNPKDAKSVLQIHAAQEDTKVRLTFDAVQGRTYTVQYRHALGAGDWILLTHVAAQANSGPITVLDTPNGSARFYRVITPSLP